MPASVQKLLKDNKRSFEVPKNQLMLVLIYICSKIVTSVWEDVGMANVKVWLL